MLPRVLAGTVMLPTVYLVMLAPVQSWLVLRSAHPIRY